MLLSIAASLCSLVSVVLLSIFTPGSLVLSLLTTLDFTFGDGRRGGGARTCAPPGDAAFHSRG